MAISYSLDIAADKTVVQVAWHLYDVARSAGGFDATVTPEALLEEGAVTASGMWISVGEDRPMPWGHPVAEDLGFTPTVSVRFRLDGRRGDTSDQQDDMIRLTSGLLGRVDGDAVLHYQFEDIWLLRRGAELSLSERDDLWIPERLAVISQPYRRSTHTFSDE
ncbi:SitI3 family protein [Streptomyces sp. NPDC090442]|uniref:SitI3 family protein n=1 Tax=Streptomyces sp. NPDC090442 TaxID=3365962 RepID=UPI00381724E0